MYNKNTDNIGTNTIGALNTSIKYNILAIYILHLNI